MGLESVSVEATDAGQEMGHDTGFGRVCLVGKARFSTVWRGEEQQSVGLQQTVELIFGL